METIFGDGTGLKVVKFCADEVEIQGDTPSHVYHMVKAWERAYITTEMTPEFVKYLGYVVKPGPWNGWRTGPITINYQPAGAPVEMIPTLINQLFYNVTVARLGPLEIFQEFELIHPFRDGNGRVGQIIYNWFNLTMLNPVRAEFKK